MSCTSSSVGILQYIIIMRVSILLLLLSALIAHYTSAQSGAGGEGDVIVPVRQNPLIIPGVGTQCPDSLDDVIVATEEEAEYLLSSVVDQIECTYLGNC